jgi:hypothetical protein
MELLDANLANILALRELGPEGFCWKHYYSTTRYTTTKLLNVVLKPVQFVRTIVRSIVRSFRRSFRSNYLEFSKIDKYFLIMW